MENQQKEEEEKDPWYDDFIAAIILIFALVGILGSISSIEDWIYPPLKTYTLSEIDQARDEGFAVGQKRETITTTTTILEEKQRCEQQGGELEVKNSSTPLKDKNGNLYGFRPGGSIELICSKPSEILFD